MTQVTAITTFTLATGQAVNFAVGGRGTANVICGPKNQTYTVGLQECFLGPFDRAATITVTPEIGTITYGIDGDGVINSPGTLQLTSEGLTKGGVALSAGEAAQVRAVVGASTQSQDPPCAYKLAGVRAESVSTLTAQEQWLGSKFDFIIAFAEKSNAANSWSQNLSDTVTEIANLSPAQRDIHWAIPVCTGVEPIAQTISGQHDSVISEIAKAIAASSTAQKIHIRIGWEANFGVAYPWGASIVTEEEYKAAFIRVSSIFKGVDSRFTVAYCPSTRVDTAWPFESLYPGNSYVDVIGMDAYLLSSEKGSMTNSEHSGFMFSGPCGINRFADFAAKVGKPLAINEWGVNYDNPEHIGRMADFIRSNNVAYHAYWDQNNGAFTCKLSADQWPLAAYEFVKNFGPFHIETWGIPATPGSQLFGQIEASKPLSRIEVVSGAASVVGRTAISAPSQISGACRITVRGWDERGQSASRSVVLAWKSGRLWTPAEFGSLLADWNSAGFYSRQTRHILAVKSTISMTGDTREATAPSAGQRPTLLYANGIPYFAMDGTKGLSQSTYAGAPAAQAAVTYCAMLYTNPASSNFSYILSDSDSGLAVRSIGYNAGNIRVGAAGGFAGGAISGQTASIVVSFGAGASAACSAGVNGATPLAGTVSIPSATYSRRVIGASANAGGLIGSYYNGHLYEWFSVGAALSQAQEDQAHGYLAWKYGKESQLPTEHSYYAIPPFA